MSVLCTYWFIIDLFFLNVNVDREIKPCEYMYVFVSFLGNNIETKIMDQSYQFYLLMLSTTTLFTGMLTQNRI